MKTWKCGACGWVMQLGPHVEQTWCPCGWRKGGVIAIFHGELRAKSQSTTVDEAA